MKLIMSKGQQPWFGVSLFVFLGLLVWMLFFNYSVAALVLGGVAIMLAVTGLTGFLSGWSGRPVTTVILLVAVAIAAWRDTQTGHPASLRQELDSHCREVQGDYYSKG